MDTTGSSDPTIQALADISEIGASFSGWCVAVPDLPPEYAEQLIDLHGLGYLECAGRVFRLSQAGRDALAAARPELAPAPKLDVDTQAARTVRKHAARDDVITFARPVPQADLTARWGVGKPTVSEWLREWEMEGIVRRTRSGRTCTVQAASAGKLRIVQ